MSGEVSLVPGREAPARTDRRLLTWPPRTGRSTAARMRLLGLQTLVAVGCVGLFEIVSRANTSLVPRSLFPPPSEIFAQAYHTVQTGVFWQAFLNTAQGWGYGLAIAFAVAIPLGLLLGSTVSGWGAVRLLVDILRSVPTIVFLPLLILLMGLNLKLKVFLVAGSAFFPLLIQAVYGVQDVEAVHRDMARAYRLRWRDRVTRVVLPTTLPYIGTGLRLAAVIAVNVAVAEEVIAGGNGGQGFGALISQTQNDGQFTQMYVYVLATATFCLLITIAFRRIERRLLSWHPSTLSEAAR